MFEHQPKCAELSLIICEQDTIKEDSMGCKGQAIRAKHTLVVTNACFGIKQKVKVSYSFPDADRAEFCQSHNNNICNGANIKKIERPITAEQEYWLGKEKSIITYFCWDPNEVEIDFNMHIHVSCTPCSVGSGDDQLRELCDESELIVYGKSKGEACVR